MSEKTLEQRMAENLEYIEKIRKEQEAAANLKKLESEWVSDPTKKVVWENGLGEALKGNPTKAQDADWLAAQMELATMRYQVKNQKPQEVPVVDNQNFNSVPAEPSIQQPKVADERDKPIDLGAMEYQEIAKKFGMTEGQAIMAKVYGSKYNSMFNKK